MTEEFISREAAMKAANEWVSEACMAPVMRVSRLFDKLAKVPAADVAEVVRCKDCKHKVRTDANGIVICSEGILYDRDRRAHPRSAVYGGLFVQIRRQARRRGCEVHADADKGVSAQPEIHAVKIRNRYTGDLKQEI